MKRLLILIVLVLTCLTAASAETLYPALGDGGLYGFINAQAEWVIPPQFDWVSAFRGDYALAGMADDAKLDDDGIYWGCDGVIDRTGAWVLAPEYDLDSGYDGSYYGGRDTGVWLVTRYADTVWDDEEEFLLSRALYGFFDVPTGTFSGLKWASVWPWCSDSRLIPVTDAESGLCGYADRSTGEVVIGCAYHDGDPRNFYEGIASVAHVDEDHNAEEFFLIDERGETIPLPEGIHSLYMGFASCGRIRVKDDAGLQGFADLTGKLVVAPQYVRAEDFSEDRAAVQLSEGEWGYIDPDGALIARGFEEAGAFADGYAEVVLAGETRFITPDGSVAPGLRGAHRFAENGLAWVRVYPGTWRTDAYLINEAGETVSDVYALPELGEIGWQEGMHRVHGGSGWGFVNERGELAIPAVYRRAEDFVDGLARVDAADWSGYIDREGRVVYSWPNGRN